MNRDLALEATATLQIETRRVVDGVHDYQTYGPNGASEATSNEDPPLFAVADTSC